MKPELTDLFACRHIGPRPSDIDEMLAVVGAASLDVLMDEVIPPAIRLKAPLDLPDPETESQFLARLRKLGAQNKRVRSFIGLGYYNCVTPSVILRNVLENPGWYTSYTPYQAEVAQGRLEALLNFQTMVEDLTGMEVANASLLDEATAAAEAMAMLHRIRARRQGSADRFIILSPCFPQTVDVVRGRAEPLGIEIIEADASSVTFDDGTFGMLLQYPDADGQISDLSKLTARAHEAGVMVAVSTDLLALTLIKPPGEQGADVVVGSAQRFGVPIGYGGPHPAFLATGEAHIRQIPGRLIGVSIDSKGKPAYRMALQTREQHIRRERATSNICTAQALLANIAGMYAIYHGPLGLTSISRRVHGLAQNLADGLEVLGYTQRNSCFFDTLRVATGSNGETQRIRTEAEANGINFRYFDDRSTDVGIACDEVTSPNDIKEILEIFARVTGAIPPKCEEYGNPAVAHLDGVRRRTSFLSHPVFNSHHSELQMMRYLKQLERKDIGLDTSMIALGSCTMKLNAATEMRPITWPEFSDVHPFAPQSQAAGYHQVFSELENALRVITGFDAISLQPNSGSQGEFAGLMTIRAYHEARGDHDRVVVLIPASAHGTNPASASMAGMQVIVIACDDRGNVDLEDLKLKASENRSRLSSLMITYPSTHGVFEEPIKEICDLVHAHGGQVYMDGANMNAQVGLTSPSVIGADVCHINLHKTFAIPHGGGGPGMGPIAVAPHLAPFLPGHSIMKIGGACATPAVSAAPWGSASILLISHAYICLLGWESLADATRVAILNANYIKSRLERHFPVLYTRTNGRVAHELIFDLRPFKGSADITESDVAKRLIDFGFHAPTVSFPVPGTIMVEPTESEPRDELDRFCDAMKKIREEIQDIIDGRADAVDNVLRNSPHTADEVAANDWNHAYSREQAAFPLPFVRNNKFWPPVSRIDNAHGDRHVVCSCPPVESYSEPVGVSTDSGS
jgi:glycine dehydrogenase